MRFINLLFSVLLVAFGSAGFARHLRELVRAWSSRRWPTGEAVVVSAAVHERRGGRGRTVFEPAIEFRYKLREREYVGHRLAFGDVTTRSRAEAERVAERFRPGTLWQVTVCDHRPELSVLHPGPTGRLWFGFVFFLGYIAFAVAFFIDALRRLFV